MKEVLRALIGAVCSVFVGFLATRHRARTAGKVKFAETMAERRVAVYGKGLELIRRIQSTLLRGMPKEAFDLLCDHGGWFADSLILLPPTYVEKWRLIKGNLASAALKDAAKEQTRDESKKNALADEVTQLWHSSIELAREAEASIHDELG